MSSTMPILKDFPSEFTTDRLLIRMPLPGDGLAVHDAIIHSLPELKPWMIFAQHDQTVEDVEANIRESHAEFIQRKDLRLLVFLKETGEFVASSGLHRINWSIPKFEIGYWVDSRHSGKGYITEAVEGIGQFAFEQLGAQRVEIRCDSKNVKSRSVAERAGYILEGILKSSERDVNGGLRDTCVFAKVKPQVI
ncbi:GNAT family N-acetyltransferase [Sutcliffiella horikoshii]|uniref:GNAT family N-acetyltransferase n=1 Tax=Sutcliffiella horikoshii TaxID=79883 RepID=A0A5D4SYP1_9BACI|nr:GNAT family N-acetyltransferase [Sutcliffiella horikoshii]TYS67791.1 GNAT family N-acetyltransferase [Sutcliffiella horikoshii]